MTITPVPSCNQEIYSHLRGLELLKLRVVSKATKDEVEKTKTFQRCISVIKQRIWSINFKSTISNTQPAWLHSNGKKLRILNCHTDLLWVIDPDHSSQTQLIHLAKVNNWKKVFWNATNLAVASPDSKAKYTTTIFDTESGKCLSQHKDSTLFPIDWMHQKLLMQKKDQNEDQVSLLTWDFLNELTVATQPIISFNSKFAAEIACKNEQIYCLSYDITQPFTKIDLQTQRLIPLINFSENNREAIKNFGVTDAGNIFFSKNSSFVVLNGENARVMTHIELPITPSHIKMQFPFMACSQKSQFFVYDIRTVKHPIYRQDYLTWNRWLRGALDLEDIVMCTLLGGDPYSDLWVSEMAFHNQSLFVCKDNSIEQFNLVSGSTTFLNNIKSIFYQK